MKKLPLPAKRTKTLTETTVVNVLKAAADPKIISFAGGVPSPKTFPIEKLKKIVPKVFSKYGEEGLQYQPTQGILEFRKMLAVYLAQKWHKRITAENILITCGAQQAIDIIGKTFIEPEELIIVERPCYFVALQAFSAYEPKFAELPIDNDQLNLDKLLCLLRKKPKIFYLNPSFQNPTGRSLLPEQRRLLADLANQFPETLFVEDAPYADLYFAKQYPDLIKFSANIIHLGTFSKTLAPGLRLGYLIGPKKLVRTFTLVKQSMDLNTNSLSQLIVNELLSDQVWFAQHLKKIRKFYSTQARLMQLMLEKNMPENISWTPPKGGLFFWLKTKNNTQKLYKGAIRQNVAFVPGHVFFAKRAPYNFMRLSFATVDASKMEKGIKTLSKLLSSSTY